MVCCECDGRSEVNYATYHDRYRRIGVGWKFTERIYEVRYVDSTPLAGFGTAPGRECQPTLSRPLPRRALVSPIGRIPAEAQKAHGKVRGEDSCVRR
jgi:hypothetical protein